MKPIISDSPIKIEPICPDPMEHKIVERLKKQIEELAEGCYLKTELQKILGEDK